MSVSGIGSGAAKEYSALYSNFDIYAAHWIYRYNLYTLFRRGA